MNLATVIRLCSKTKKDYIVLPAPDNHVLNNSTEFVMHDIFGRNKYGEIEIGMFMGKRILSREPTEEEIIMANL